MKLIPGDHISGQIAFTGFYELALSRQMAKAAMAGGLMIDVGANLGYYSLLWVSQNLKNRCLAFEASPRNILMLKENIIRNHFVDRIEVKGQAVGKQCCTLRFDAGPKEQSGWGGFTHSTSPDTIDVDVVRLDDAIDSNTEIALLKVDIEGADTWALMGCENLLRARSIREIWFEQNKPRMRLLGIEIDAAQQFLDSVGYTCACQGNATEELVEWRATPTGLHARK